MPSFQYIARDKESQKIIGIVEGEDMKSVVQLLAKKELIPINILPRVSLGFQRLSVFESLSFSKPLFLSIFCSSFSRLLKSGLSVPKSISILSRQFNQRFIKVKLQGVLDAVNSGAGLSEVLSRHSDLFPAYLVALCRAGENSGSLPEVLEKAAAFFDRLRKLKKKITAALTYPSFLAAFSAFALILLFLFVLPRIGYIYEDFDAKLPWQTEMLLAIGNYFQSHIYMIALFLIFFLGIVLYMMSSSGKHFLKGSSYKFPLLGKVISQAELADQLSITGILLNGGVSLPEALDVTGSLTEYTLQKKEFENISRMIESGQSLASSIKGSSLIPAYAKDILSLGEEADCLPESLENSSEIMKGQVEQKMTLLTSLFEPIIVIFIAVVIGFIMFSILWPIFNLDFMVQ